MSRHVLGLALALATVPAHAQAPAPAASGYDLVLDRTLSARAGADALRTLHGGVARLEDRLLPLRLRAERTGGARLAGVAYRAARYVLLDRPLDHFTIVGHHEVFGHGGRYREFGWRQEGYIVHLPFPYGDGHGLAYYGAEPSDFTVDRSATSSLSGSASTRVLADRLREGWLAREAVPYREASLYVHAALDLPFYVASTDSISDPRGASNDVQNWLNLANYRAGFGGAVDEGGPGLSLASLKRRARVAALDPALYVAAYAVLRTYLLDGERAGPLPMLRVGSVRVLPTAGFHLAPYASEWTLAGLVTAPAGRTGRVSVRRADGVLSRAWGAGAAATGIVRGPRLGLDGGLDVWRQPPLALDPAEPDPILGAALRTGGALYVAGTYRVAGGDDPGRPGLSLRAQVGLKTEGYLPGEELGAGPIVRLGLRLDAP